FGVAVSFLHCVSYLRDPLSFPTRRSSDLRLGDLRHGEVVRAGRLVEDANAGATVGLLLRVAALEQRRARREIVPAHEVVRLVEQDRKSTRLNSSHVKISYAVFCLKKKLKR